MATPERDVVYTKKALTQFRWAGGRTDAEIEACKNLALQARFKRAPPDLATWLK